MSLTILQLLKLEKEEWRVFTSDVITQNEITKRFKELGIKTDQKTTIFYNGKAVPVFIVPFAIVKSIAENRKKGPYSFTAYHKESPRFPWVEWKEGKSTPNQTLTGFNYIFKPRKPRSILKSSYGK